ncbi:MAG: GGDEF domain-containing protein [Terracidiphilus sp.]
MISLKKYLDATTVDSPMEVKPEAVGTLPAAIAAYRSALLEMGGCSLEACPALGDALKRGLGKLSERLSADMSPEAVVATDRGVQEQLLDWGKRTASHYRQKTDEVKGLLIVMARTAESVGERDLRCAGQINEVTARLEMIASLDDLSQIRSSIEKSAGELKGSVERMAAEGRAAIEHLRAEVSVYQTRLEEAEEISSRDALTGVRSRLYAECNIVRRIDAGASFCVVILDIDGFKQVNDEYGHLVGDELLKQFATELVSVCRSTDVIARWGGDEFLVLMDCSMQAANLQVDRLREWVCGKYKVQGGSGTIHLTMNASIGLAKHIPGEPMKLVLDRADAAMYQNKAASRETVAGSRK